MIAKHQELSLPYLRRKIFRIIAPIAILILPLSGLFSSQKSLALPLYTRRYNVPCETCHSVAPRLNTLGLAFQANHFQWPDGELPPKQTGLAALPISTLTTFSSFKDVSGHNTNTDFNTLELFASDGFSFGGRQRAAGYFVDYVAAINRAKAGALENAFISLPVAGPHGELALTAGQFSPMTYQYDPINSLTQTLPAALGNDLDAFTFTDTNPGLRLEFFDKRGRSSPDGNYLAVGIPFQGSLSLNSDSRLYDTTHGLYANAFHRWGQDSLGLFGYTRSGNSLEGIMATKDLGEDLHLLGISATGKDDLGSTDRLSLQAEYVVNPSLAVTGRLESVRGQGDGQQTYPVAAVTYYPFRQRAIRLTAETVQAKGNRSVAAYLLEQY